MDRKRIQQHIRSLVRLDETSAPVISCYLNLDSGIASCRDAFQERAGLLRKNLDWHERRVYDEAFATINDLMSAAPDADTRGMAIFARGGASAFLIPLQFDVPLPTWITVNSTPHIYHLEEVTNTYDHFVIVITTEKGIRVWEVNLGKATEALWQEIPETHETEDWKCAKQQFQSPFWSSTGVWLQGAVQVLEVLMSKGGYEHLILAGDSTTRTLMKNAIPERMAAMVAGVVSESSPVSDVVRAAITSFVQHQEMKSLAMVEQLQRQVSVQGLATTNALHTLNALQASAVDVLVMAQEYKPAPAWQCADCGKVGLDYRQLDWCSLDGRIRRLDLKEEMIRLAELHECAVETVKHSDVLMRLGGVGAILRCRESEVIVQPEMAGLGKLRVA